MAPPPHKKKTTYNMRGANRDIIPKNDKTTASNSDVISIDNGIANTESSEGNDSNEVSSHTPAFDESKDKHEQKQSSTNPHIDPSNKNLDPALLDLISGSESVSSDIDKYNERVKRKEAARTAMAAISVASQDSNNGNDAGDENENDSTPATSSKAKKRSNKDDEILELKKRLLEEEEKNKKWLSQQKRMNAQKRKRDCGNDLFSGSTSYYSTAPLRNHVNAYENFRWF
ncbi:unnamed protein product [Ambrosiozyma monospora]|uniref:Unnamed protein product n=1 Tax=Ambrosiozyma monospora TaxID=43982 RepID=A0ACB5TQV5_AMBMO|nr:unnamed protein product [Ambrosiozyma monospora]